MGRPKKRTSSPRSEAPKPRHVVIRSNEEWSGWLERVAAYFRTDVSKLLDMSVTEFAKSRGFNEPPPPRY
jgi:hypothetical protein